MRVYNLPVNADLIDMLDPSLTDWNYYTHIMHYVLEVEYCLQSTGALCSAVEGRGHPAHIREFL